MHDLSERDASSPPAGPHEVVARRLTVAGRVQGVWFRRSLQDQAQRLEVVGWVRNRVDGTVEAWLEGAWSDVDRVIGWVRAGGPSAAVVDTVDVAERDPVGHRDFSVR